MDGSTKELNDAAEKAGRGTAVWVEVGLSRFGTEQLLQELRDRSDELDENGIVLADIGELERLHDNFYTDPQHAVDAVRAWLRKATGRV